MVTVSMFIDIIPRYEKWAPALPIFYILAISSLILSLSAPFMNLFNALGKVKITFIFMVLLTTVNWIATPLLTQMFGVYGFPLAHILVSLTLGLLLYKAKRLLGIRVLRCVSQPLASAILMGSALYFLRSMLPASFLSIGIITATGTLIYYTIMKFVFGNDVFKNLTSLYEKRQ